jgi:predicted GTPase
MDTADPENIEKVRTSIEMRNPGAKVIEGTLPITVDQPDQLKDKKVLVVEDGPTLTHGNMSYGAGVIAAKKFGVAELVSPRFCAVGSIQDVFEQYVQVKDVLPAMGYSDEQVKALQDTINACECELVVVATPIDLGKLITVDKPLVRVIYEFKERQEGEMEEVLKDF